MKPTFLGHNKPLLTVMIQAIDPDYCISTVRNSIYDGADAFGFQICKMKPQYRTVENYRKIFSYMEDKPIYITNYRDAYSKDFTDDERAEELITALKCGATLCDIMGDLYDPSPLEMTKKPEAIDRQKKLIDKIHTMGGEVIISSHIHQYLPPEQVLEIAKKQEERGCDIVKIVTRADSEEELLENLKAITLMKKELKVPFLFLANGRYCKIQRTIGPMFGCVMFLCVQQYDRFSSREQPLLRATREVLNNFDWKPNRE